MIAKRPWVGMMRVSSKPALRENWRRQRQLGKGISRLVRSEMGSWTKPLPRQADARDRTPCHSSTSTAKVAGGASRKAVVVSCRQDAESNSPYIGFGSEIRRDHGDFARIKRFAQR